MEVRDIYDSDLESISALHLSSGQDFALPDLSSPLVIVRKAVVADGKIQAVGLVRITSEGILILDPALSPRERIAAMYALERPVLSEAYGSGLTEITASIHNETAKHFSKRLTQFGWTPDREDWHQWSLKLHG